MNKTADPWFHYNQCPARSGPISVTLRNQEQHCETLRLRVVKLHILVFDRPSEKIEHLESLLDGSFYVDAIDDGQGVSKPDEESAQPIRRRQHNFEASRSINEAVILDLVVSGFAILKV